MMIRVILDTNFLLIPSQFNLDIFSEIDRIMLEKHQVFIIDKTLDELEKISGDKGQKTSNRQAARLGIQLLRSKNISIIKTEKPGLVDNLLVEIAEKNPKNTIVATQDMALKRRLKCRIITLRAKKTLILV